jgi:xanthine dehydrogenase YagR molybdenum-binding subunit
MTAPIQAKAMSTALSRVDGPLKVTGTAKYPAEFNLPNLAYAFLVTSPIAKGRITAVDSAAAEKLPGVLAVITHQSNTTAPPPSEWQKLAQ